MRVSALIACPIGMESTAPVVIDPACCARAAATAESAALDCRSARASAVTVGSVSERADAAGRS